jgi:hypothetical protein
MRKSTGDIAIPISLINGTAEIAQFGNVAAGFENASVRKKAAYKIIH